MLLMALAPEWTINYDSRSSWCTGGIHCVTAYIHCATACSWRVPTAAGSEGICERRLGNHPLKVNTLQMDEGRVASSPFDLARWRGEPGAEADPRRFRARAHLLCRDGERHVARGDQRLQSLDAGGGLGLGGRPGCPYIPFRAI